MSTEPWRPSRLLHRQMYIDLIRAYLPEYGSQRDLARSLGVTEAYISYVLKPVQPWGHAHQSEHWSALTAAGEHAISEAFKSDNIKTPSAVRAREVAARLASDSERRETLLHHIELARRSSAPSGSVSRAIDIEQAREALTGIGNVHQIALFHSDTPEVSQSYATVWEHSRQLMRQVDYRRYPVESAQTMLFAHDAAQVLNRPDLALGLARNTTEVLAGSTRPASSSDDLHRLRLNAILAEVVSLNTLGLADDANTLALLAERLPGYSMEPQHWKRSFLEQQLRSMSQFPASRIRVYEAEKLSERSSSFVSSASDIAVGVKCKLLEIYVSHIQAVGSGRSVRTARRLAEELEPLIFGEGVGPLRRAIYLRAILKYFIMSGEKQSASRAAIECLRVAEEGNFIHQRQAVLRDMVRLSDA